MSTKNDNDTTTTTGQRRMTTTRHLGMFFFHVIFFLPTNYSILFVFQVLLPLQQLQRTQMPTSRHGGTESRTRLTGCQCPNDVIRRLGLGAFFSFYLFVYFTNIYNRFLHVDVRDAEESIYKLGAQTT
jgi:hypothetical protein